MKEDFETEMAERAQNRRAFLRQGIPLAAAAAGGLLFEGSAMAEGSGAPVVTAVTNIADLRKAAIPATDAMVHVSGYHKAGDGGGGTFVWDAQYAPGASDLPDDGGTCLLPQGASPDRPGRWRRLFSGPLNVKWFGALGDDSGKTPAGIGIDIMDAPWNNHWPQWIAVQRIPKIMKFASDDSWDYIGTQLALLSGGEVTVPAGRYRLSKPLIYSGSMRATLSGAGMYQTILTRTADRYKDSFLLVMNDTGGAPTTLRDLTFMGPSDAQSQSNHRDVNFTLIYQSHTNGVHLVNCWLTSCHLGILFADSTDCYVTDCTAEYCATVIKVTAGTDLNVSNSNFWQSAPAGERYTGIESAGSLHCVGNRFVGFEESSILCTAGELQAVGNYFFNFTHAIHVIDAALASQSVISGNRIVGTTVAAMVEVGQDSLVTGNYIDQRGEHACINLANGKTNINVSGNMLCCIPADKKIVEGGLIISVLPNVNFSSGCSQCLITGNTLNQPDSIAVEAHRNTIVNNLMAGKT